MEKAQREVILGLLDRGWRVRVVARTVDLPHHENLEVVRVRIPQRPAPLEQLAFAARAPRARPGPADIVTSLGAIVAWTVDVVIVQYVNRAARGARAAGGTRAKRAALRVNSAINHEIAVGLERWCYRPARVQRFLPVSDQLTEGLGTVGEWCASASVVVPNGVDLDHFTPDRGARARTRQAHGIAPTTELAVFVGGDWERKGLRVAIGALALAPDWHLLVVGRGAPAAYREHAHALGCADRLYFSGESRDAAPLLAAGDVFVLPTRYEGFPLSAIEAASTGLPLLLTRESNADGLLHDNKTGFWIQRDAASVAARLNELGDVSLRTRMGHEARRTAHRFAWSVIVDQHVSIYLEILAARGSDGDSAHTGNGSRG
jgi:glycosyltransferase involved in cell wall biosynthesis